MSALENIILFPIFLPSKLIVTSKTFTKQQNLVLGTADLTVGSNVTMHLAKMIQVHGWAFTSWSETWRLVYQIEKLETQRAYANNIVA